MLNLDAPVLSPNPSGVQAGVVQPGKKGCVVHTAVVLLNVGVVVLYTYYSPPLPLVRTGLIH